MRVLLVTNDYPPTTGGIQQYLANLVDHSSATIMVLAPSHPGAPEVPAVVRGHSRYMLPTRRVRRWIEHHISEFRPHVLVFGAPHPLAQLGPRLTATTAIPYVVIAHGAEVTLPGAVPGLRQILARTFRRAALVFTVSAFTARKVASMSRVNTVVLGAGVDLDTFRPGQRDRSGPLVLACISRFVPRKGHLRVIKAAEELAGSGLSTRVLIAGQGRLEARIRRRAARATVPVDVEVDVPTERLADLYRSADLFVMPARSRWFGLEVEGLGIVYLEALSAGLPVVAGRSGGAPETVIPGESGYIAESVREIVEAVQIIAPRREDMGLAARQRALDHCSWHLVAQRFDHELNEVVIGRASAGSG